MAGQQAQSFQSCTYLPGAHRQAPDEVDGSGKAWLSLLLISW